MALYIQVPWKEKNNIDQFSLVSRYWGITCAYCCLAYCETQKTANISNILGMFLNVFRKEKAMQT